jgi:serine/threonine-protein kinase OSR1/STK39
MSSSKHKNIVREHATFIDGSYMWIFMNIIDSGSMVDIMKLMKDPKTRETGIKNEAIIATIIKETMHALHYFHTNGKIHRDVKAGNILLDMQG